MYSNPPLAVSGHAAHTESQPHRPLSATLVGSQSGKTPRMVILGRPDVSLREPVSLHLDSTLLKRLDAVASGSRSLLIEMALRAMVDQLEDIDRRGGEDGSECVMLQATQIDELVRRG